MEPSFHHGPSGLHPACDAFAERPPGFLTDLSSEMIYPLLPIFLVNVLGAGAIALGTIEGIAESTASILKVVSGAWTDRIQRREPLVVAGYGLSGTVRPLNWRLTPERARGGAFGLYHGAIGLTALPASILFGAIYAVAAATILIGVSSETAHRAPG